MQPSNITPISISTNTILRIIFILLAFGFLWVIRDILAILFVALIFASAFEPTVGHLERYRIPRVLGMLMIYVLFFSLLTGIIMLISGPIVTEVKNIALDLPRYYDEINNSLDRFQATSFFTDNRFETIRGSLDQTIVNLTHLASGNVLPVLSGIFGGLVSIIFMFVLTFYLTIYEGAVRNFFVWILPDEQEKRILTIIDNIQHRLGKWLRGQMVTSLLIFIFSYVGLRILNIKYALILALLAGFFEVVPYLGPLLSGIPAVLLTLIAPGGGIIKALMVVVLFVVIQQAENYIITPKIMSKSVGLNPLVVIIAILIGAKVGGAIGAIVAVPVATAITVYFEERDKDRRAVAA